MTARWVTGLAIGALLIGSAAVVATAPDNDDVVAPFPQYGVMGDTVSSRTLIITVNEIELADRLVVKYREIPVLETNGVWVVVDATTETVIGTEGLSRTELRIGDVRYRVSGVLPPLTPLQLTYGPGVPQRGSLVFEVPRDALEGAGAARASLWFLPRVDSGLDSVPVVEVDLSGLDVTPSIRIDEVAVVENDD